ncbi:DUF262 domain-containing protein [Microbacterium dextranolyticum]|uniref:GmrSD restriction endonucleases N-terminal domain-containing protein n=1 Tax=Microbacterium dextranolyticum TaxID=36806 RepID=A0A9W6HKJ6_9MICO|nr:DUF262 domain-containing protein [Microbacterium dextranolyticum]MBM7462172.1 hypothetical protein [Microbacterium dextranolyticum]GLJ94421.1 hypothetical protein GCM10017591_04820 [Microbacterium dextranolyticum]
MTSPNLEQPVEDGRLAPRDIVQRRLDNAWDLALVQRDEVWKEDRIRLLLDSLIMGYPVGSLLFCQIDRPGIASIPLGGGQRAVRQTDRANPQLVDGQQRVFAIYSIFTGRGYGRFYVNAFRDPSRDAGYILWRRFDPCLDPEAEGFNEREAEPIANRDRYLDLSNWHSLGDLLHEEIDEARLDRVTSALDAQFRIPDDVTTRSSIATRLESIRQAWFRRSIPMISATVRDPEDVLEVFSRVNRGGAPVSGNDLYFAAVKTFWHDPALSAPGEMSAHAALQGIADATDGLLDVYGALSLLSRLSLAGIGLSDMVPVNVDRLSKANKNPILRSMKLSAPHVATAVQRFTAAIHEHTQLGYALRITRTQLWEDVFGWVVASDADREWTSNDVATVEDYVLGASLFGYQQVLGDAFRRDAFAVAIDAGSSGRQFPLEEIIGVAHGRYPKLKRGRQLVRGLLSDDERLEVARSAPRTSRHIGTAASSCSGHDRLGPRGGSRQPVALPATARLRSAVRGHAHLSELAGQLLVPRRRRQPVRAGDGSARQVRSASRVGSERPGWKRKDRTGPPRWD